MPLLLKSISVAHPAKACVDEVKGRTPVILSSENGEQAACTAPSALNGYIHPPRRDIPSRRPPPYRSVPLPRNCRNSRSRPTDEIVAADCASGVVMRSNRARSVPPKSTSYGDVKSVGRPKSLHQQQLLCVPSAAAPSASCAAISQSSAAFFPHSVSLQFDTLPEWPQNHCLVPSPAPAERRSCHRSSRTEHSGANKCSAPSRSSSLPRPNSPPRTLRNRPLSHPAGSFSSSTLDTGCRSSLSNLRKSETNPSVRSHCLINQLRWPGPSHHALLHGLAGSTPAPAPSPSSTPSPSRLLAHLPSDALCGVRTLEKKLELYVDILQSQERFVQVLAFSFLLLNVGPIFQPLHAASRKEQMNK